MEKEEALNLNLLMLNFYIISILGEAIILYRQQCDTP